MRVLTLVAALSLAGCKAPTVTPRIVESSEDGLPLASSPGGRSGGPTEAEGDGSANPKTAPSPAPGAAQSTPPPAPSASPTALAPEPSKPAKQLIVSTLLGGTLRDGDSRNARFYMPQGLAVDSRGEAFIADTENHRIRRISPAGQVTTWAGGRKGFADGVGSAARFNSPLGVAVGSDGTAYVADVENNCIRKIGLDGHVTTLAGDGTGGYRDGTGLSARFYSPRWVVLDGSNNLYVADYLNNRIRKIAPSGEVTTLATVNSPSGIALDGTGALLVTERDYTPRVLKVTMSGQITALAGGGSRGFADGTGSEARFYDPTGVAAGDGGTVYVADKGNHRIRRIDSAGQVTTLAGNGTRGFLDGDGPAARFDQPIDLTVTGNGDLYVADAGNHRIRKVTPQGATSTLAGDGTRGFTDGNRTTALMLSPSAIALDTQGNVYFADLGNQRIRKVSTAGDVTTLAGDGTSGFADGAGAAARFDDPVGLTVDRQGNVVVADTGNHRIRKISPDGQVSTLAGDGVRGFSDGAGTAARFYSPSGVAADASGTVYVADTENHRIRKIAPDGIVTTLAGDGISGFADGKTGRFYSPKGIAVDGEGNVFVADTGNRHIRRIGPAGGVTTLADSSVSSPWDPTSGGAGRFDQPEALAVDGDGNLYVADKTANRIRKITRAGLVSILAGDGFEGFADGDGPAASFASPRGVAVDAAGNVYIADYLNAALRVAR